MATRKPVVINGQGQKAEIPSGDYTTPEALGAGTPSSDTVLYGDNMWASVSRNGPTDDVFFWALILRGRY